MANDIDKLEQKLKKESTAQDVNSALFHFPGDHLIRESKEEGG
jgi:hypothetical protein